MGDYTRALAELNRNCLRIPEPNMLINTISLQEAQSSSAIENIFTTELMNYTKQYLILFENQIQLMQQKKYLDIEKQCGLDIYLLKKTEK